jgi:hypothetical protein
VQLKVKNFFQVRKRLAPALMFSSDLILNRVANWIISKTQLRLRHDVMVSFTFATSALSAKGLARKANCSFSGRLLSKASSA